MAQELHRRRFVAALLVLPAGTFLVSCSDDAGGRGAAAPRVSGDRVIYTSTVDSGHSHTFSMPTSALDGTPAEGVSGETSSDSGHTHSVSVSTAELERIATGESIKKTTSADSGHSHLFTFVKVA